MDVPAEGLRARKKARTRETIIRSALELFARDGFAATTISDIADAADVSPRTISTYFPHKEEIVFAAYRPGIDRLAERLAARRPEETVIDVVGDWLRTEPEPAGFAPPAIARDPDLWALQRRHMLAVSELIAAEAARDLDPLAARIVGAATVAAILELDAADGRDVMLGFLRAGFAAVQK
jgi:AcrR family transcriptional regulator